MGFYQRAAMRLSKTSGLRWVISKALTPLDMALKGSSFAPSRFGLDLPLCFLTTTGRRTGKQRTVPLLFIDTPSGSRAVAASNFGRTSHPRWALNLVSKPQAILEIDGESKHVTARRSSQEEATELWPLFDSVWPGYEEYRSIAPREIKVFILE